ATPSAPIYPLSLHDALPIYLVAQLDALVADEHRGPGDQLSHLMLALAAEGAVEQLVTLPVVAVFGHCLLWKLFSMRLRRREAGRSEEHTSELQSRENLVCRL